MTFVNNGIVMKKLINIIGLLLVFVLVVSNQRSVPVKTYKTIAFKIIKVNGKIYFVKSGADLKTGGIYIEGTPIEFSTHRDRAAIVNEIRGRYILQPSPKGKAIVLPATSNIEPRAGGSTLINHLDVINFFADTCVFIGPTKAKFGKESFPLDETHFFYITYNYQGEKIAKKIESKGQTVIIDENMLFEIDGKKIPTFETEMILYYRNGEKVQKMNAFVPVFPNQETLKVEVSVLLEGVQKLSKDKQIDEVTTFVNEFYGKPQKENLNAWLEREFSLTIEKNINFK